MATGREPVASAPTRAAPLIGYLYPSGYGNLGDEAIQRSFITSVRAQWPAAQVTGFTLQPEATTSRHGIDAHPITGVSHRYNAILFTDLPWPLRVVNAFVKRVRRPWRLHRVLQRLEGALRIIVLEPLNLWRGWRWLRRADLLVAAGGGQLDDIWGGPWGHPYALARWAWLSRRARVPFVMLSVGVGKASDRVTRAFLRYAVRSSDYCSLRDEGSRALTAELADGTELCVVPDLAFGLHKADGEPPPGAPPTIGVSPMAFRHHRWPEPDTKRYRSLIELFVRIVTDRVERGERVRLFTTDRFDEAAVDDVLNRLDERTREQCTRMQVTTVSELLDFYARVDLVVATRLHGVLMSLVAERPPVALSYERKVRAVMEDAGMSEYCLEVDTATPEEVIAAIDALAARRDAARADIAQRTEVWRRQVHGQAAVMADLVNRRRADR